MATITAITAQKKAGRANIYLDGRFFCGMQSVTVVSNHLAVGTEISEEELGEIQRQSETNVAFDKCVAKLSVRMRSKKELTNFLKEKGFLPEVIQECMKKLEEYGYVNDLEFAKELVRSYPSLGRKMLQQKLSQKGVDVETISQALSQLDGETQKETAIVVAKKFIKSRSNAKNLREKLMRHLAYKGFDYEIICFVLDDLALSQNE